MPTDTCGQTYRRARSISDRLIRTTRIAMCLFNGVRTRMFRRTALQKRKQAEQKMYAIQSLFDLATRATDGEQFAEIGRATSELQSLKRISYAVFSLKKIL